MLNLALLGSGLFGKNYMLLIFINLSGFVAIVTMLILLNAD